MAAAGAAGLAFQGLSLVGNALGSSASDTYRAQRADEAAQVSEVQGEQLNTQYNQELSSTLSNIRAIRASSGGSPDSPSSLAYQGLQEKYSDEQRFARVGSAALQADQYQQDASFLRSSAKTALLGGALQSLPKFAGAWNAL